MKGTSDKGERKIIYFNYRKGESEGSPLQKVYGKERAASPQDVARMRSPACEAKRLRAGVPLVQRHRGSDKLV